jgi:ribulose-phosphate 3-epimerase
MVRVSPSILAADFSCLYKEIERVEESDADLLHIDVMDGHFVRNLSIGPAVVECIRDKTSLIFDVHLMVEDPYPFVPIFIKAGADIITIHVETHRLYSSIRLIKNLGRKVGIALNPHTPLSFLEYIANEADIILIMAVDPGFGGQLFIPSILPKIMDAKRMIRERHLNAELAVDGGINEETAPEVVKAGASILVMGSAIFGKKNTAQLKEFIRKIKKLG